MVPNGRDPAALAAAAERLRAGGGYDVTTAAFDVTTAAFDVTDRPATEYAVEEPGDLDILVDNAGHRDRRGVAEMSPQELNALLDTDLTSAHALSQTVARGPAARGVRAASSTCRP
ncbi:SDR family NAD(P)-dependent oxidoreductase [Streptomyces misionensis]|uniref:SDR family NAD(P)-dependent oxidoreductase n=1 Tax=Streptomyces misionensis TaxID=67331 RepID=UPI00396BAB2F